MERDVNGLEISRVMWDTQGQGEVRVLRESNGRGYVRFPSGNTGWVNMKRLVEAEIIQVPSADGNDWGPAAVGPKKETS